jgi:tripartite-type tricarboxylate transporter receptor subunit TctC
MAMLRAARDATLASAVALAAALGLASDGLAQNYPAKPIRLVVPFAPGGPADVIGRIIAQQLNVILGQSLVIDNRGGAGGTIGARFAATADPDGYTLMFANTSTLSINPAVYRRLDYDPAKAFAPVALIGTTSNILVVNPALPVTSIAELVAYGNANPGKLSYATPGAGTPPHMIGEMFKQRTGLDITHVPYKGGGSAIQDVVSGQVSLTFENPALALPLVLAGQIRALAVTSAARNPRIPDVPTLSETIPGFVSASFTGVVAPAGVSRAIIARLNAAINESLKAPAVQATLDQLSVDLKPGTPEEFGAFLATEKEKWLAVAHRAKIQLD